MFGPLIFLMYEIKTHFTLFFGHTEKKTKTKLFGTSKRSMGNIFLSNI